MHVFFTKVKLPLGLEWHKVTNGMKRNEAPSLSLWEEIQLPQDTTQQPLDQVPNPMHGTPPLWAEELLHSAELRLLSEASIPLTPQQVEQISGILQTVYLSLEMGLEAVPPAGQMR